MCAYTNEDATCSNCLACQARRPVCYAIVAGATVAASLQFSYQFAIATFWSKGSYMDICNFHIRLQFSYQFAILMSQLQHFLKWRCMVPLSLWPWPLKFHISHGSPWKTKSKLVLSKIDYCLLLKYFKVNIIKIVCFLCSLISVRVCLVFCVSLALA